ncbi:FadR/GntR family transcriptional regulator [Phaeacidiphilus oryzae]|uniref:FadR/GntR family transcriptional regulator n=1 Tax=Phaeacidiphilus oryzae TaxID=348818 RepID=UPI00055C7CAA|nr:FCD domain-containing protein [Phaeacidiphilus oryzae]
MSEERHRQPLGPLHAPSTAEQIAHRLATAIALGEFSVGERLPSERELAATLEVSRESVRGALRSLAESGQLEIRRGRGGGAFVRADWAAGTESAVRAALVDRWPDFEALFDYRRLVESLVARTAAERATPEDREAITAALAAFDAAASPDEARGHDTALHLAVARATHNPRLIELHERLLWEVSLGVSAEPYTWAIYHEAAPQHHALARAVLAGDADQAAKVARAHFGITEEALRRLAARIQHPE